MFVRLRHSTLVRGFVVLVGGAGAAQLLTLLASPLLTRLYTPREIGMWSTYTAILMTLSTMSALRFDIAIVVADSDKEARGLFALATRCNLAVATVTTMAMLVGGPRVGRALEAPELIPWFYLMGLNVLVLSQCQILLSWFTRHRQYSAIGRQRVGQAGGTSVTQVACGALHVSVAGLVVGTLLGGVAALSLSSLMGGTLAHTRGSRDRALGLMQKHWKMPVFNGTTVFADAVRINGIQLAVAAFFSQQVLGLFALAWRSLLLPVTLISGAIATLFFERFSHAAPGTLLRQVRLCLGACILLAIVPFTLAAMFAPAMFAVVFGREWYQAGVLARLMCPYIFMSFLASPISTVFIVTGKQELSLAYSVAYLGAPLIVVLAFHDDIYRFTQYFSWLMAGMLATFIAVALSTARKHDLTQLKAMEAPR